MNITSLIVSTASRVWGIFVFWFYDRKIKIHTLKKFEDEELETKKAKIEGSFLESNSGSGYLVIKNIGKASAKNVRIVFLNESNKYISFFGNYNQNIEDNMFLDNKPVEICLLLTGNSSIKLSFCRYNQHQRKVIEIKFLWDDDFKTGNECIQSLQLW